MEDQAYLAILVPLLFFTIGPLFWSGVCFLIGTLGGWRALAETYARRSDFTGKQKWTMQSAGMRIGMSYRNTLTVGVEPGGLHLAVFVLFRPGHAPLSIPWQDISVKRVPTLFGQGVELRFRRVPDVPLRLRAGLFEEVAAASGGHLVVTAAEGKGSR